METIQIVERFEKRRLIVTLGEAGAPAQYTWEGVLFTERQDGSEFRAPAAEYRPATAEEVEQYLGKAAIDIQAAIEAKDAVIASVRAEAATQLAAKDESIAALRAHVEEQQQVITQLRSELAG